MEAASEHLAHPFQRWWPGSDHSSNHDPTRCQLCGRSPAGIMSFDHTTLRPGLKGSVLVIPLLMARSLQGRGKCLPKACVLPSLESPAQIICPSSALPPRAGHAARRTLRREVQQSSSSAELRVEFGWVHGGFHTDVQIPWKAG